MLGCDAAVIETVSPSQLMPSETQRMWTSSIPFFAFFALLLTATIGARHALAMPEPARPWERRADLALANERGMLEVHLVEASRPTSWRT